MIPGNKAKLLIQKKKSYALKNHLLLIDVFACHF